MFPKPKRIINRKLFDQVKKEPCSCCGTTLCIDTDHIETVGAGGDDIERNLWPLCRAHHTEKGAIGLRRLAAKYPHALRELEKRGFEEVVEDAKEIIKGQLDLWPF